MFPRCATITPSPSIARGERTERGEATLDEAAKALAVSPSTVRRLIAEGVLAARQSCKGAPGGSFRPPNIGSTSWSAHRVAPKACARFPAV